MKRLIFSFLLCLLTAGLFSCDDGGSGGTNGGGGGVRACADLSDAGLQANRVSAGEPVKGISSSVAGPTHPWSARSNAAQEGCGH